MKEEGRKKEDRSMDPFPHRYVVDARCETSGPVDLRSEGAPDLVSAAPKEFGGPGDQWSPETLFVGAVVDCFLLSFRAVAAASKLDWVGLRCRATGTLDRVDRVTRFVAMEIEAELALPADGSIEKGERILEKAEQTCLVSNSLAVEVKLESRVTIEE